MNDQSRVSITKRGHTVPRRRTPRFRHLIFAASKHLGLNAILRYANRGKLRTLVYHNVLPNTSAFPFSLTPDEFERQLILIKRKHNPVYLDSDGRIGGMTKRRVNVLMTFDDGFINNFEHAFPILAKHGLKATFFLIVDCVESGGVPAIARRYVRSPEELGRDYRTVTLPQVKEMMAAGMTFGSHTYRHTDLTQVEWAEGVSMAQQSADRLAALLGCNINVFAFPWGRFRPGQVEALAIRFRRVFTTRHGFSDIDDSFVRRDEAAGALHLEAVVSGSRDLLCGIAASVGKALSQLCCREQLN